jgi:hypothetical protein
MKDHPAPAMSRRDLSSLSQVPLGVRHAAMLESAKSMCGGAAPWRHRKLAEAMDLCRLAELCGRLTILRLDVAVDLRADLLLRVTVPCLPDPAGPLVVAEAARLGVIYREQSIMLPQPGYSFVQILTPRPVWHPNVSPDAVQVLCLGTSLPAGVPLREIILMTYGALAMLTMQLDPADSAGLLNPAAADLFQRNPGIIPLSREPFLQSAKSPS